MTNIQEIADRGELFDGHYKLLRPLSTDGATADVWLALDTNTIDTEYDEGGENISGSADETGMLVAIKIYRPKNALDIEGEQRFRDEYKIVFECRHENLLQPTSFAIYKDIPYLVLPYCKNGSSEQLIGKKQTTDEIWKFISDVASGLAKLHSNQPQIIHQDVKPANILIDNNYNYTITDFGISSKTNGTHSGFYGEENSGTLAYMAPERFEDNSSPTVESDIWAFGATLCEILTGKVPFGEEGGRKQNDNTPLPTLSGLPTSIKNLIHACLQKDPKKRPTARQLVQAAHAKQYPIKRKTALYITLGLIGCLLIGALVYLNKEKAEPQQKTFEERYETALAQLNSNNLDTLVIGLQAMEDLSKKEYIPAMYQTAFTYGWYSDPQSVRRKEMLGIKMNNNNFPLDDKNNNIAKGLFSSILEISDTLYPEINSESAYRLACYYGAIDGSKDGKNKVDTLEAKKHLDIAEKWANMSNDTAFSKKMKDDINFNRKRNLLNTEFSQE
jgi:serine/threonine protein kinase